MKRNSRRCMNIPDYFLGKPYHKVISRGEQIKPNLFFVRDGEACAFVRHPPRATSASAEKPAHTRCEIHSHRIPPATPAPGSSRDHIDRVPLHRQSCAFCSRNEPEPEITQRSKKTRSNHKDGQKSNGANIQASPCHCTSHHSTGTAPSPLTHCHFYPPTPNVCGMTCHQEHYHHECHSPAPAPAMACPYSVETPKETDPQAKCTCKRPNPPPRAEPRLSGCCCTDDAKSISSLEYGLSDDSASDSSVGAVVEDATENGEARCSSCHHFQLVCCCRHGVLYGTR